ncbi:MAG: sulfotransferase family protein [Acidimicrobiia bacterium]
MADAVALLAGARGMTPWVRPSPLPTVAYPKVFVVGCPRSGTTWVADILQRHPRVVGGRESHLYPTVRASIGTRGRSSVTAWARLLYGVERGSRLERNAGPHHYVDRRTLARLARDVLVKAENDGAVAERLIRAVFDTYFLQSGGTPDRVFVEKTPTHIFYAEQILSMYPEARVVEVVRDGRDVCVSMEMRAMRIPGWPTARDGQIDLWARSVRHGLALRSDPDLRDRVTVVRYEDLKADTPAETERLYSAAGLDASPALVADVVAATDISRYRTGPGEIHHKGEVGTWIEHFSAEDDRLFRSMVGDLFAQSGYTYD